MRGFVYTARDVAGNVLYVGTTRDVPGRMNAHRRRSTWWSLHATIEVEEFATLEEAAAAENDGICRHDPPYNVAGGHRVPGACAGRRCRRVQAERTRWESLRARGATRSRQCALPLQEWDRACGRTHFLAQGPSWMTFELALEDAVEVPVAASVEESIVESAEPAPIEPEPLGRELADSEEVERESIGPRSGEAESGGPDLSASIVTGIPAPAHPVKPPRRGTGRSRARILRAPRCARRGPPPGRDGCRRLPVLPARVPDLGWPP